VSETFESRGERVFVAIASKTESTERAGRNSKKRERCFFFSFGRVRSTGANLGSGSMGFGSRGDVNRLDGVAVASLSPVCRVGSKSRGGETRSSRPASKRARCWLGHYSHKPSSWRYSKGVFEYSAMALLYASWPWSFARTTSAPLLRRVSRRAAARGDTRAERTPAKPRTPPRKPPSHETRESNPRTLFPRASRRAAHMVSDVMSPRVFAGCVCGLCRCASGSRTCAAREAVGALRSTARVSSAKRVNPDA